MLVVEACRTLHGDDSMLLDVLGDELPFGFDDRALAVHEVADGDVLFDADVHTIEPTLAQAREIERGFAQRLAGNRARIDGGTTGLGRLLDEADALSEIFRLRAPLFAHWA